MLRLEASLMTPTKILIGQALVVFLIIGLALFAATQFVAISFGFDRALGKPWFVAGDWPVYYPWRLFEWWFAYEAYAPDIFMRGGGDRRLALARASAAQRHDLRLGALGREKGH